MTTNPSSIEQTAPPTLGSTASAPPLAQLIAGGAAGIDGMPGSWCYGATCLDAPPPAKGDLPQVSQAGGGAPLTVVMPSDAPFVHWRAWYATTADGEPTVLGEGGSIYDIDAPPATPYQELTSATFGPPAGGDWVLGVDVGFDGDHAGDAHYYWRVVVP